MRIFEMEYATNEPLNYEMLCIGRLQRRFLQQEGIKREGVREGGSMITFAEALKASNQEKTYGSIIKSTTVPNLVKSELQRQQDAKANTGKKGTLRETDRDAYD